MKYFLCLVFFGLLAGCQNQHVDSAQEQAKQAAEKRKAYFNKLRSEQNGNKDSAPKGPIPTLFQKIIPKSEPLSRYGNPDVYKVNGQTYEVIANPSGYHTRGLASWYGTKFHTRRTSSGEHYNMYALTAAHRTLPLPTYVRVRNLKNGRVTIVKVNDRGPFHRGRVIDLSYAAAAKLGVLPQGTAPVEIEALSLRAPKARTAHYYLQAGAFNSSVLAKSLRSKLAKLTKSPVVVEKYQQRYIVRLGPFVNRQTTDRLKKVLSGHGVNGAFSLMM